MIAERLLAPGLSLTATRTLSCLSPATKMMPTPKAARIKLNGRLSYEATRVSAPRLLSLRMLPAYFGSEWAIGITFLALKHQRMSNPLRNMTRCGFVIGHFVRRSKLTSDFLIRCRGCEPFDGCGRLPGFSPDGVLWPM